MKVTFTSQGRGNHRVQVFDPQGRFILQWGSAGSRDGEFSQPQGLAIDGDGNVYVSEYGNSRIQAFDPQGRFLREWGSEGSGNGEFRTPQGLGDRNYWKCLLLRSLE
ncbi:MAG: hypothetical protein CM1200mP27_08490 [Chloroflexota bacterium]|nr:MAG: hypothetical protein CM1200mP27_08490 [Chloroflexota bacterium]